MPDTRATIESALASYDRNLHKDYVLQGERERSELTKRFPLDQWSTLPLERYALGQEGVDDTFCRWMEFLSLHLGSIRGGSARKLIIYKRRDDGGWYHDLAYKNEQEAWRDLRSGFVSAFEKAQAGDWNAIDEIAQLQSGPALRLKALHVYFPDHILPIYTQQPLKHFLRLVGEKEADAPGYDVVRLNRVLLEAVRRHAGFAGWSTNEIDRFLYWWADPRQERRVVKIAPGEDAKFWDECLRGGYICVGWDEVGDLREYDSKEAFRAAYRKTFAEMYNNHAATLSKKANEVWTLLELEPGDLIVANKGTSRVLAIGTVVEPGYVWSQDRRSFRHTVRVNWDTSYAKEISPQRKWAMVTVAAVPTKLYETIVGDGPPPPPPVDPLMRHIAEDLERRKQVVLYGPPGTGKTFHARRFAVAWLLQEHMSEAEIMAILADRARFAAAERDLSTVQASRRVWWVVANPKQWNWDQLFKEKRVSYMYGRLRRNYPLVKKGDLVVGYQSTPDRRVVALARVTRPLGAEDGEDPTIEIEAVGRVKNGLTYDELVADAVLNVSEPVRFNNQGTLFALTPDEADHLLSLLAERDQGLQQYLEEEDAVRPLTNLTFHPSYSYEDFVEGFRPVDNNNGVLSLRLTDGVFKRVCRAALAEPSKRFLLFIDEINRANLAKVFGELITLLESDKRGMYVTLPQSKESFCVPPNVFVLGTMNTADRSIKLLDTALRRRFAFIELMPDVEILRGETIEGLALDDFLEELNRRIVKNEGREKQVGHSFLLDGDQPVTDKIEFARRFRHEILPLLQEYCYDDYSALESYLGPKLVDKDAQILKPGVLEDPDALLAALVEEFGQRDGRGA